MSFAIKIFGDAFARPRTPRSDAYKFGVLDVLKFRFGEQPNVKGKDLYMPGTAEADAYWSGCDEGHRLYREYEAEQGRK